MRLTALSRPVPARTGAGALALTLALTLTAVLAALPQLGGGTAAAATSATKVIARHSAGATFSHVRASRRADRLNWRALARCEAGGNPRAANPAGYYGLYQFTVATWRGVGGHGYPHRASRAEQTMRAKKLFQRAGSSPWPTCGRRLYA
jgi:soluble lytic murein transglycosylase-like protein